MAVKQYLEFCLCLS